MRIIIRGDLAGLDIEIVIEKPGLVSPGAAEQAPVGNDTAGSSAANPSLDLAQNGGQPKGACVTQAPLPTVLDEPSVIAIREGRVEVAPTPDIPGAMATIGEQVRAAIANPPQPVERPAELALSRPHTDDLAFPDFLDRRKGRAA